MFSEEITEFVECDNVPRVALDDRDVDRKVSPPGP
jgi:hypothetical protein